MQRVTFEGEGQAPSLPGIWRFEYWGYPTHASKPSSAPPQMVRMAWSAPFHVQGPEFSPMAVTNAALDKGKPEKAEESGGSRTEQAASAASSDKAKQSSMKASATVEITALPASRYGDPSMGGEGGPHGAASGAGAGEASKRESPSSRGDFLAVAQYAQSTGSIRVVNLRDPSYYYCESQVHGLGAYSFSLQSSEEARLSGTARLPSRESWYCVCYCMGGRGRHTPSYLEQCMPGQGVSNPNEYVIVQTSDIIAVDLERKAGKQESVTMPSPEERQVPALVRTQESDALTFLSIVRRALPSDRGGWGVPAL